MDKVYINDAGTVLEASTNKTLTGATTLRFEMTKPDGTTVNWNATIKAGDNTVAQYTIQAGDLDQAGVWKGQVYAEWSASQKWHGETFEIEVYNLGE